MFYFILFFSFLLNTFSIFCRKLVIKSSRHERLECVIVCRGIKRIFIRCHSNRKPSVSTKWNRNGRRVYPVVGSSGIEKCRITYRSSWAVESKGAAKSRCIDKRNDARLQCTTTRQYSRSVPRDRSLSSPPHFRERKRRRTRDSAGFATSAQAAIMSISNTTNRTQLRFYAGRRRPFSLPLSLSGLAFRVGLLNSPGEIVLSFRPRAACTGRAQKHFIII